MRAPSFLDALARDGFARLPSVESLRALSGLGDTVLTTTVALRADARTYLTSPGAVPLHTDHPRADWVAWRCETADPDDGALRLLDAHGALRELPAATLAALHDTWLPAMERLGDVPAPTRVLAAASPTAPLFYAPWLAPLDAASSDALHELARALARHEPTCTDVRLTPGECVVVDNHRVLHGRRSIREGSPRRLIRHWIARRSH